KVPNAALRWQPSPKYVVPEARDAFLKSLHQKRPQGGPRPKGKDAAKEGRAVRRGTVWVRTDSGLVRPVPVELGLSDGTMTEVVRGDLTEEMEVVVGETARQEN